MMYAMTKRSGMSWAELDALPLCQFGALLDCVLDEAARERSEQRKQNGQLTMGEAAEL